MQVQWYPGHMAKTKKMLREHISLVDLVIELLDARIPHSSRNPDLDAIAGDKSRVILLNKADLAAPVITKAWLSYFEENGHAAIAFDSRGKAGLSKLEELVNRLTEEKRQRQKARGRTITLKAMVVGIPNVGKSTFINQLAGRAGAVTGDKPGVTRGRQWIKAKAGFDLLDTPGVLWPKFEDAAVGVKLAATGAVSDDILDKVTLCEELLKILSEINPKSYLERYKLPDLNMDVGEPVAGGNAASRALLEKIGIARGFKLKGGAVDTERAAITVLDEFRGGKLGRVSLERPF